MFQKPNTFLSSTLWPKRRLAKFSSLSQWASIDPMSLGESSTPYHVPNLVNGNWINDSSKVISIPHPMKRSGHPIFTIQDTQVDDLRPFIDSMANVPKSGVHNPLKNVNRYLELGEISRKVRISDSNIFKVFVVILPGSTNVLHDVHVSSIFHLFTLRLVLLF